MSWFQADWSPSEGALAATLGFGKTAQLAQRGVGAARQLLRLLLRPDRARARPPAASSASAIAASFPGIRHMGPMLPGLGPEAGAISWLARKSPFGSSSERTWPEPAQVSSREGVGEVHALLGEVEEGARVVRAQRALDLFGLRPPAAAAAFASVAMPDREHAQRPVQRRRARRGRRRRAPARRPCAAARPRSAGTPTRARRRRPARRSPSPGARRRGGGRRSRGPARAGPCAGRRARAAAPSRRCRCRGRALAAAHQLGALVLASRGRRPRSRRTCRRGPSRGPPACRGPGGCGRAR